jgi:hypothetical protein
MRSLLISLGLVVSAFGLIALPASEAHACGGGMVSEGVDANVAVEAQRVFVSARKQGTTDIVAQLEVTGSSQYGVLIPLPSAPTLDTTPIASRELDALDEATRVRFYSSVDEEEAESGGCGSADKDGAGSANDGSLGRQGGVTATEFVDIGPVSASVLQADTSAALAAWLEDNGFAVAQAEQDAIDAYVGQGQYFIAVKRADGAPSGRSSVGLHFTLQGDQRGYPLRMARIGAASEIALSVYVAAEFGVGPTAPFQALTLNDLGHIEGEDDQQLAEAYEAEIRRSVAAKQGKAFLVEGVHAADEVLADSPTLFAIVDPGARLTRLTTVVASSTLDTDVAFTAPAPEVVPTSRDLAEPAPQGTKQAFLLFGMLLPAMIGLATRRRR